MVNKADVIDKANMVGEADNFAKHNEAHYANNNADTAIEAEADEANTAVKAVEAVEAKVDKANNAIKAIETVEADNAHEFIVADDANEAANEANKVKEAEAEEAKEAVDLNNDTEAIKFNNAAEAD